MASYSYTKSKLIAVMGIIANIMDMVGIEYRERPSAIKGMKLLTVRGRFNIPRSLLVNSILTELNQGFSEYFQYDNSVTEPNRILITFVDKSAPEGRNRFTILIEKDKDVKPLTEG